jgi:hypothetical protein
MIQASLGNPNRDRMGNASGSGVPTPTSDIQAAGTVSALSKNWKLESIGLFYLDLKNKDCIGDGPVVNLSH